MAVVVVSNVSFKVSLRLHLRLYFINGIHVYY